MKGYLPKKLLTGVKKEKTGHIGYVLEYYRLPGRIVFIAPERVEKDMLLRESWFYFTLWVRVKLGFI